MSDIAIKVTECGCAQCRYEASNEIERLRDLNTERWESLDQFAVLAEWQPIETAPKDGSWVWVYVPAVSIPKNNGKRQLLKERQLSARWHKYENKPNAMHPWPSHAIALGEKFGGLWSTHTNGRKPISGMPTHWRPLPDSPSESNPPTQGADIPYDLPDIDQDSLPTASDVRGIMVPETSESNTPESEAK